MNNLKPRFYTVVNSNKNVILFILDLCESSSFLNKVQDVILIMKVILIDGKKIR